MFFSPKEIDKFGTLGPNETKLVQLVLLKKMQPTAYCSLQPIVLKPLWTNGGKKVMGIHTKSIKISDLQTKTIHNTVKYRGRSGIISTDTITIFINKLVEFGISSHIILTPSLHWRIF